MKIDDELMFILASKKRIRILYFLDDVKFARGYEIADMILMAQSSVSVVTKQLIEHDLVDYAQHAQFKMFFLTEKGKKMVKKVREYYGPIEQ